MRVVKTDKATDDGKSQRTSTTVDAGEPTRGTPSRKGVRRATEPQERKTPEQRAPDNVSTKLERIAKRARERPQEVITMVSHFIDVEWMREAYSRTRKDGATGIDGKTAEDFAANLEENLVALVEGVKAGTYRAPPVKRVYIPKGDGTKLRPIGIPTFEDKVLQRAVAMALEAVYEQQFRNCSYGFRPRRGAHDALTALRDELMRTKGGFVIDVDIEKFFDSLDHTHLRTFLDLRVRDGVMRRAIDKWLKAGVLENGSHWRPEDGTPQGGVISPLLANIFLHHVLDVWFEDEIKPLLKGRALLVRYADDFVIVVGNEEDAKRLMDVLPKRFGKFGLKLHSEKTRLVHFKGPKRSYENQKRNDDDDDPPETFDLLGFTHYWGKMKGGGWAVKTKTASTRVQRTLRRIFEFCKEARHWTVAEQHEKLRSKLVGHYQYFAVPGNLRTLSSVRHFTERIWRSWLNRRSSKRSMPWERFKLLLQRYPLPRPRVIERRRPTTANT